LDLEEDSELFAFRKTDVLNEEEVDAMVSWVMERYGRIDVLVNIVGGWRAGKTVAETDLESWNFMLNLNLKSAFLCSKAVLPHMIEREDGSILSISSRAALETPPRQAAYNVAKAGVITLTRTMATEVKRHNINVNAVLPKTIDTPENREAMPDADFSKWVEPEAIARVILFLTSEDSRITSGAAVPVYGQA
jgi:NAD(P)-dependent dehydrogenase (short-subunit alcohol dehydrogenase family)